MINNSVERRSIVRFVIVGTINTGIDIIVFFTLHFWLAVAVAPANILAFLAAVSNSYFMNRYWSFAHRPSQKPTALEYGQFLTVSVLAVGISTALLVYGQAFLAVAYLKFIAALFTPIMNFLLYRYFVFTPSPSTPPSVNS